MFGSQRRLVRRCECETDMPKPGPLAQTSQTAAIVVELLDSGDLAGNPARVAGGAPSPQTGQVSGALTDVSGCADSLAQYTSTAQGAAGAAAARRRRPTALGGGMR